MKYLQKFKQFSINEAYKDLNRGDYNNDYDYAFANYALNERPFGFNDEDRERAKKMYGNREVGVVYHGGKLDNKERADKVKSLKPGDTIKANMMSATPEYSTAESFALYVKSYDELTMMYALKDAIERGSAGEYGTFVVTLKPKPEQVIYSTYGEGETPTRSAETEVVLYGDIEVVDIKIFEPLNKETYLEDFMEMHPNSLNNDFMKRWFRNKKLERPDSEYIKKLLSKIKNKDEAIEFITKQESNPWVFDYVTLDEAKSNKFLNEQLDNIIFDDGNFYFDFPDKKVYVGAIEGLKEYVWNNNRDVLKDFYNELLKDSDINISFNESGAWHKGEYNIRISDKARTLLRTYRKLKELGENPKLHKEIENVQNQLTEYFDDKIIGKHLKDFSSEDLKALKNTLRNIEYYGDILIETIGTDVIKPGLLYLYQKFAHRFQAKDRQEQSKIRDYGEIIPFILKLLTAK